MVIAASHYWFGLMVSDRLVTLQRLSGQFAGPYDPLANKTVIFLTEDAVLVFGYTGSAYLAGLPTDQWIAQTLWGAPIEAAPWGAIPMMRRGLRPGPRGLNHVLFNLRRQLAQIPGGMNLTLAATGFRMRRGRLVPVLVEFKASTSQFAESGLTLRPPRERGLRERSIGASPAPMDIAGANAAIPPDLTDAPAFADYLASLYTEIIRRSATRSPTVGRHAMTVTIPRAQAKRIFCRFDGYVPHHGFVGTVEGSTKVPVAYSPWVVSDVGFDAAGVMSGVALTTNLQGWSIEYSGNAPAPPLGAPSFFMEQTRMPPPGGRR